MASPVKAKKHLGQHFLIDLNIAQKIVNALPQDDLAILEIGPGTGVLTQYLIEKDNFTAFDIDTESIEFLKQKYPEHQDKVQFQDFLEADLHPFAAKGKDARRINQELDDFMSDKPMDVIAQTRPILIIDEPQTVEGVKEGTTQVKMRDFKPLMTLRYSATHREGREFNFKHSFCCVFSCKIC